MIRILKYPLAILGVQTIETHEGAEAVHVGEQSGVLTLWMLVNNDYPKQRLTVTIVGTERVVLDALREARYPVESSDIRKYATMRRNFISTLRSLGKRGLVSSVVRRRDYENGWSETVMGFILTPDGERAQKEG